MPGSNSSTTFPDSPPPFPPLCDTYPAVRVPESPLSFSSVPRRAGAVTVFFLLRICAGLFLRIYRLADPVSAFFPELFPLLKLLLHNPSILAPSRQRRLPPPLFSSPGPALPPGMKAPSFLRGRQTEWIPGFHDFQLFPLYCALGTRCFFPTSFPMTWAEGQYFFSRFHFTVSFL